MNLDEAKPSFSGEVLFFTSIAEYQGRQNYTPVLTLGPGEVERIIGKYELPADRTLWASCGLNNCNTEHRFGYVILAKDGRETNIGQDCGKRELGVSFEEVEATFKRREDEAAKRRTIDALLADKKPFAARAAQAHVEGALQAVRLNAFIKTFSHLQGFWREVINASKLGGVVRAPVVRNDNWSQMGREQLETVARFQGSAVLLSNDEGTPELVGRLVQPWLNGLSEQSLQMLNERELETAVQEAGKMRDLLERAEKFVKTAGELLSAENIEPLQVICDRILRSADAGYARPYLTFWLSSARTGDIPIVPVKVAPQWR